MLVRLENSEAQLRTAQRKILSTEKTLADVKDHTQSSTAALAAERGDVLLELKQLEGRSKALEGDLEQEQTQKTEAVAMANRLRGELADRERELKALQATHDKAQKDHEAGRKELEAQIEDLQRDLEAEKQVAEERLNSANEKENASQAVKKEISELKAALAKGTKELENAEKRATRLESVETELREALAMEAKAREKAEQDLARPREGAATKAEKEATSKSIKRELATLREGLAREVRAREKAERELAIHKADDGPRLRALKKQVEELKTKAKQAQADAIAARTTTTKVPLETSRKRPASTVVTMDSFESAKKPRREKEAPAISEISLTPFLQRNAAAVDASAAAAAGDRTDAEHLGDISIVPVPAGATSRILLAGANRKKYVPKLVAEERKEELESPLSSPPPRTATPPGPAAGGDEEDVGEDSMLSLIKPPVPKPAKPKPKSKPRPRAKAVPRQQDAQQSPEAEDPAPARLPEKQQQPPVRRRKKLVSGSSLMGINPTRFDDDGTGRISINLDADPQADEGDGRLAPVISDLGGFRREISPPKKRPAALGGLFTKKS